MSLSEKIPLMREGSTVRNIMVGIVYLVTMPIWLVFLPFILFALVWRDYGGIATSLSSIPGISEGGGIASGAVAFVLCIVFFGIIGSIAPSSDDPGAAEIGVEGEGEDETSVADEEAEPPSTDDDSESDTTDDEASSDDSPPPSSDDSDTTDDTTDSTDDSDTTDETSSDDESESDTTDDTTDTSDDSPPPSSDDSDTTDGTTDSTDDSDTTTPAPDGESYAFSGSGNRVTDSFDTDDGLVVIEFDHDGSSNFQVQAVNSAGDREFLVNEIGTYDGAVALYLPSDDWRLDVTADGRWSADVTQPRFNEQDVQSLPMEAEGEHAAWFGPFEFEGNAEVTFEIKDDSHAAVWLTRHNGEKVNLVHNEIGPYDGTALVTQRGIGLIVVDTDSAEWRIQIDR